MTVESPARIEVGTGFGDGASALDAGAAAARAALDRIREHEVSALLIYASVAHDLGAVLRGVHEVSGNAPVIGATTAGELLGGLRHRGVVAVALASPDLRVCAAVGQGVSRDWRAALEQALAAPQIRAQIEEGPDAYRRRARRGSRLFAMLFAPGNTRDSGSVAYELLEAFKSRTLGRIPVFAGAAADDWRMEGNAVFLGQDHYGDSLLLAIFETELSFGIALGHGFRASAVRMRVTQAEGRELLSLDGEPAAKVLARKLGTSVADLAQRHITLTTGRTFGTADPMGQYSVNVAAYFTERGGVRMTQPLAAGAELVVMEPVADTIVAAGAETLRKALVRAGTGRPAAVLCHYCALRPRILGEEKAAQEIAEMVQAAGSAPVAGFCSFGEGGFSDDGVSRQNNASIAVLVFGNELSVPAQAAREIERLHAELSARAEMKVLQEALQQTEEAFAVVDAQFRFQYVNPAFTRLFGYRYDEIVGRTVGVIAPDDGPVQTGHDAIARIARIEHPFHGEVHRRAKDGRMVAVLLNVTARRDDAQSVNGYIATYMDIGDRKVVEAKLRESEARFRETFENAPIGMLISAVDGSRLIAANRSFCEFLGYQVQELRGMSLAEVTHPDDLPRALEGLQRIAQESGGTAVLETRYRCKDGRFLWGQATASVVRPGEGLPRYLILQIENIELRKRWALEIAEAKDRLALAMEASQLSLWDFDISQGEVTLDHHWAELIGLPPGATVTTDAQLWGLMHKADLLRVRKARVSAFKGTDERFLEEFRVRTAAGDWKWIRCSGRIVERGADGWALRAIGTILDITDRRTLEEQSRQMAFHDGLTGLPNRRMLEDRMKQLIALARREQLRIGVLFIDLDKFKPINDELGHEVGDWLLRSAAHRMRTALRESDTIARIGGDEFVVLLPDAANAASAIEVAEKIRDTLNETFVTPAGRSLTISSSIGVVMFPQHADNARDLLRHGDEAMYQAKKSGRNAVALFREVAADPH